MTSIVAGQSITLASQWYAYSGGPATDLTAPTITIKALDGLTTVAGPATPAHAATGVYTYTWVTSAALPAGDYLAIWGGVDDQGDAVTVSEIVTVYASGPGSPVLRAGAWYCTREEVAAAADIKETARSWRAVDRACDSAVQAVDGLLHRTFLPVLTTRTFDWPGDQRARPWRLWLDANEVISLTTLVAGGVTIAASDYFLRPDTGPPYTRIEIDLDSAAAFAVGPTHQRAIAASGLFGYGADTGPAGSLGEALDDTETAVDVTDSAAAGVGDVLLADSERMIVSGKTMLDTGVDVHAGDSLTANTGDVSITLSTATGAPVPGETILIDSERMLVVDVAGSVATVKRAVDGSVLATHAGSASIHAPRTLTVTRGALGTTAAAHTTATALYRHLVPGLIRQLAIAEALVTLQQESAAYARTAGSGDNEREVSGRGLKDLRAQAYTRYGRKARKRAI